MSSKRRKVTGLACLSEERVGFRLNRRQFLGALGPPLAGLSCGLMHWGGAQAQGLAGRKKKRVALLATEVRKWSHAQHFIDRYLEGYGWKGRHYRPEAELAGLYVDQFPEGDLSKDRAARHGVRIYPSVEEALTLGGSKLAVDGVLIIGEHGKYPDNEKGQKLYPRYAFFKKAISVFERSGRAVPVFNDKHLSTDWDEAREMVADAKRLGFAFMAGSSLPVTWRIPSIDLPLGTELEESVCVCYGGVDSYDFHGFETAQCMSERRAGGERGVVAMQAVRGERVWQMLGERAQTRELVMAALARSHQFRGARGYTYGVPSVEACRALARDPVGFFMEHEGGFRTAVFLLNGAVSDFTYAGRKKGGEILGCQMYLPMPGSTATLANFFSPLVHHIEDLVETGRSPYPVERTLLTTGMTCFGVESLHRGQVRLLTPEMQVAYAPADQSTYWNL